MDAAYTYFYNQNNNPKAALVAFKCDTNTNYNVMKKIFGAKKNEVSQ
jgi:hypothetical protein